MELRFPAYYTTNVDNSTELCYRKYNRPLDVVVELSDLNALRGNPILYKFHGDLDHPEQLVWTDDDYRRRAHAAANNFMDIRLTADLLAKSPLFVGYSLEDPHIVNILHGMRERFPKAMEHAVIIAYGDAEALRASVAPLRIKVVSTRALYPDRNDAEAFNAFLLDLSVAVMKMDAGRGLEMLFARKGPGRPVLSNYELKALEASIDSMSSADAVSAFRSTCSWRKIPESFEERVANIFRDVCLRATEKENSEIRNALLNMAHGNNPSFYLSLYAAAFTLYRFTNPFPVIVSHLPDTDEVHCILTVHASQLMREHNIQRNATFADNIGRAMYGREVLASFESDLRRKTVVEFDSIFEGSARTNPLTRDGLRRLPGMKNFQQIMETLLGSMPKAPPGHG